jgi:hypothetical protein
MDVVHTILKAVHAILKAVSIDYSGGDLNILLVFYDTTTKSIMIVIITIILWNARLQIAHAQPNGILSIK